MKPLFKKFRTQRSHYVYDTWTNEILEVDPTVFHLLADSPPTSDDTGEGPPSPEALETARRLIESARQEGFFRTDLPVVSNFPEDSLEQTIKELREKGPDHLIVNITERCNLRCRYCSFSGAYRDNRTHSNTVMTEEVLHAALDWYFGFNAREEFSLGFYGGEPLADLPLLQNAVDTARRRAPGRLKFRLTTNATLLTDPVCRFLIENDFRLHISLDGPKPVHDRYRVFPDGRGSFDAAWEGIVRLHRMDPKFFGARVSFNVVAAAPIRLEDIATFTEDHSEIFQDHLITVSRVNPYPSCLSEELTGMQNDPSFTSQKEALFHRYRQKLLEGATLPEDFVFSFFKSDFMDVHQRVMSPMKEITASNGQCVPGDPKCFVGTGGALYMCERVGDTRSIGDVWNGFDDAAIAGILRDYDRAFKERCADCWALRLCNKCYVTVRDGDAFSEERIEAFCRANLHRWSWVLERYCELRETKDDAFAWCAAIG